jgi:hypothetical protein
MNFTKMVDAVAEMYVTVATWCFEHPIATDFIILGVVLKVCGELLKSRRRSRRRLHRYLWGTLMTRQHREKYQDMRIEDAIGDTIMEMEFDGSMNTTEANKKLREYGEKLGLSGLIPQKDVKRGIRIRLKKRIGLKPASIPGGVKTVSAQT